MQVVCGYYKELALSLCYIVIRITSCSHACLKVYTLDTKS